MKILKAGLCYFIIVFGAGFLLGPIRINWAMPLFGERTAELMEMPIMLVVIFLVARWMVRFFAVPPQLASRLGVGLIGLFLVVALEFTLVLKLRGLTISEYFATRDPITGTVYYLMLVVFAVMPLVVERRGTAEYAEHTE